VFRIELTFNSLPIYRLDSYSKASSLKYGKSKPGSETFLSNRIKNTPGWPQV